MKMKKILCLAGMLLTAAVSAVVPEYLVVGENPIRLEKMAEKELCSFYREIYGKDLKKISENEAAGKSVIYLGDTAFARKNGFKAGSEPAVQEQWVLKTVDDDLIIAGGRPAGTLYGVYSLLESLGTYFLAPDETVIPKNQPDFPVFDEKKSPAFVGRVIFDGIPGILTKLKKNRGPTQQAATPEARSSMPTAGLVSPMSIIMPPSLVIR